MREFQDRITAFIRAPPGTKLDAGSWMQLSDTCAQLCIGEWDQEMIMFLLDAFADWAAATSVSQEVVKERVVTVGRVCRYIDRYFIPACQMSKRQFVFRGECYAYKPLVELIMEVISVSSV